MIQHMLAIWSLVPLPFLKPTWTSGSSRFTYCWSLAWRILSITLLIEGNNFSKKFLHSVIVLVAQSCLTLCNIMDYSLPGASVHGIPEARILEWVAIPFSRGSSWPKDQTQPPAFTIWATREAQDLTYLLWNLSFKDSVLFQVYGELCFPLNFLLLKYRDILEFCEFILYQ